MTHENRIFLLKVITIASSLLDNLKKMYGKWKLPILRFFYGSFFHLPTSIKILFFVLSESPLIVSRDSFSHQTWNRIQAGGSIACSIRISLYIFLLYNIYHFCRMCIDFYDLSTWGGCWFVVYIRRFIYNFFNVCPFDLTAVSGCGRVGPVKRITTQVGWP